jgi:hypothetical protein
MWNICAYLHARTYPVFYTGAELKALSLLGRPPALLAFIIFGSESCGFAQAALGSNPSIYASCVAGMIDTHLQA